MERLGPGTGDIVFVPSFLVATPEELAFPPPPFCHYGGGDTAFNEGNIPTVHTLLDALRPPPGQLDLRAFDWLTSGG